MLIFDRRSWLVVDVNGERASETMQLPLKCLSCHCLLAMVWFAILAPMGKADNNADVIVYGATPGGVCTRLQPRTKEHRSSCSNRPIMWVR